ncbi:MAG: Crp/Fnr family transcriptional regulator [Peptostreptococcaceae bacterium]
MLKNKTKEEILSLFKNIDCRIVNYAKNDIIALEDSPCNKIGVVLNGTIDIKKILSPNKVVHISSFTTGNLFGEVIAFSSINIYPSTVISSTESEVLFLEKDNFIQFCTNNPEFLKLFLHDLTDKVVTLNKSITSLSFSTIRQKICNFLVQESNNYDSSLIMLKVTKEKLAESLGIPRPSLSRELINMKNEGLINYSRNIIKILDKEKLEKILSE